MLLSRQRPRTQYEQDQLFSKTSWPIQICQQVQPDSMHRPCQVADIRGRAYIYETGLASYAGALLCMAKASQISSRDVCFSQFVQHSVRKYTPTTRPSPTP